LDKKQLIIIAGGLAGAGLIGLMLAGSKKEAIDYGAGGGSGGGNPVSDPFIIGDLSGGSDPGAVNYNYNFPEPKYPEIDLSEWEYPAYEMAMPNYSYAGGNSSGGGNIINRIVTPGYNPGLIETTKKSHNLRQQHASGWGVFAYNPAGSSGLVQRHNESKKDYTRMTPIDRAIAERFNL